MIFMTDEQSRVVDPVGLDPDPDPTHEKNRIRTLENQFGSNLMNFSLNFFLYFESGCSDRIRPFF